MLDPQYTPSTLETALHIPHPRPTDAFCGGKGHKVLGRTPYCECFSGWKGPNCGEREEWAIRGEDPPPIRGCVMLLMYEHTGRIGERRKLLWEYTSGVLKSLDAYFRVRTKCPVYIFHDDKYERRMAGAAGKSWLEALRKTTTSDVRFVKVDLDYPETQRLRLQNWRKWKTSCGKLPRDIGYMHMGHFFTRLVFHHEALKDCEYVWRLDADLWLTRPVRCDVFEVLRDAGALFGFYSWRNTEYAICQGPIKRLCEEFAGSQGFQPDHLSLIGGPGPTHYSGGWGVFKWSFWTSPAMLALADVIADSGINYYNRTGEQVFIANAMGTLAPPTAIHQYGGHGPLLHKRNPLWGPNSEPSRNIILSDPYCERRASLGLDDPGR